MSDIQFDMFEVQLGSALLIQMRDSQGTPVRVLADAGIKAKGYPRDHVNKKLATAFTDFDKSASHRIDLMIGTHYDEDHLKGLIDVADNPNIEITEALLPPLQQPPVTTADIEGARQNQTTGSPEDYAAHLAGKEIPSYYENWNREKLGAYLKVQLAICDACQQRIRDLRSGFHPLPDLPTFRPIVGDLTNDFWPFRRLDERRFDQISRNPPHEMPFKTDSAEAPPYGHQETRDMFSRLQMHFTEANDNFPPESGDDDDDMFFNRWRTADTVSDLFGGPSYLTAPASPLPGFRAIAQLAYIQKSSAKRAIVATWLDKVVDALKKRNPPTPIKTISINPAGQPRYFIWLPNSAGVGGFQETDSATYKASAEPKFTVLGPSQALVKKHYSLLPIGIYFLLAGRVLPKPITPSNELSYVLLFEANSQQMLLTGDAGCVDFWDKTNSCYYRSLLDAMGEPHIIQIAHHAGNNSDFYDVLLKSQYPQTTHGSHLLLSHAFHDSLRPSKEFGAFLKSLFALQTVCNTDLLFTSEPDRAKVQGYPVHTYPVVGAKAAQGDVRLEFLNSVWRVRKHAVQP